MRIPNAYTTQVKMAILRDWSLRPSSIYNNNMGLKVIGAGVGRTGTLSTKLALEQLGFDKCYHMESVIGNPEVITTFDKAYNGGKVNWDELFGDEYQAAVDFPTCMFYKELMELYPDAKVLLNLRDADKWYESVYETIWKFHSSKTHEGTFGGAQLASKLDKMIWDGFFEGQLENKERTIEIYNKHIAEVKRVVPSDKLLVFNVKEGWEPLCKFLGVEVPDTSFPRANRRKEMKEKLNLA